MPFLITTGAGYSLTPRALDLINFFSQLFTVSFALISGLLVVVIVLIIYKH